MILTEGEIRTVVVLPHCIESVSFLYISLSTYYIKMFQSKCVCLNGICILHSVPVTFFDNADKFCLNCV
jgi:hypothetical protein